MLVWRMANKEYLSHWMWLKLVMANAYADPMSLIIAALSDTNDNASVEKGLY